MKLKIKKIDSLNPDKEILEQAARIVTRGGVLVCPTDTCYIFAANALNIKAVAKVFSLKGRNFSNPIHIAVNSIQEAKKYACVNAIAQHLASHFLPGALTLVLSKKGLIPSLLVGGLDTIGIRIPNNKVILDLVTMTGVPLTATSANISGKPTPYSVEDVIGQLGESMTKIALVLDQGVLTTHEVSTIIDLTVNPPQLIRQGRISWLQILSVLHAYQKLA